MSYDGDILSCGHPAAERYYHPGVGCWMCPSCDKSRKALDMTSGERTYEDSMQSPLVGDCVEFEELMVDLDGEKFVGDSMLRVLAVVENWVWFKEYGKPQRPSLPLSLWRKRLGEGKNGKLIQHSA